MKSWRWIGFASAGIAIVALALLLERWRTADDAAPDAGASVGREAAGAAAVSVPAASASVDVAARPMDLLEGGLLLSDGAPAGWSHLVLRAIPRVAEGDIDRVPALVSKLASMYHLMVVAHVERTADAPTSSFQIERVAIGLASDFAGARMTVSTRGPASVNSKLDFMARTALGQNEASLKKARQVARTPTMFVFDAETIMWRDDDHLRTIHRHALLVEPATGRLATLIWALSPGPRGRYRICCETLQWIPEALHDDRQLHVDARKFSLGLPTQEAFALVRLPAGRDVACDAQWHECLECRFDDPAEGIALERALREAVGWDRRDERVSAIWSE